MKSNSKWPAADKKTGRESNPVGNKIPKQRPKPDNGNSSGMPANK